MPVSYDATLEASTRINRDRLLMMPRDRAAQMAHEVIAALEKKTPEDHLLGIAVAFAVMAQRYAQGAEELHDIGKRILVEPMAYNRPGAALIDSLRDYAGLKVRTDPKF